MFKKYRRVRKVLTFIKPQESENTVFHWTEYNNSYQKFKY